MKFLLFFLIAFSVSSFAKENNIFCHLKDVCANKYYAISFIKNPKYFDFYEVPAVFEKQFKKFNNKNYELLMNGAYFKSKSKRIKYNKKYKMANSEETVFIKILLDVHFYDNRTIYIYTAYAYTMRDKESIMDKISDDFFFSTNGNVFDKKIAMDKYEFFVKNYVVSKIFK